MKDKVMYIENKSDGQAKPARIGWVSFSKTGRTLYLDGKTFQKLEGEGFKANYYDVESWEEYWISEPTQNEVDNRRGDRGMTLIDEDAREEYWANIREMPGRKDEDKVWLEKIVPVRKFESRGVAIPSARQGSSSSLSRSKRPPATGRPKFGRRP